MQNILSIDLESFIAIYQKHEQQSAIRKKIDKGHIKKATVSLLNILKKASVKATFFVLAEIYDWYPELIEKIKAGGHEIGFHTYSHKRLLNKAILIDELKKSSRFINRFNPKGFRAPQNYITKDCFKILKKYNFMYDSSTYDTFENRKKIDGVLELPVSVHRFRKKSGDEIFPKHLTFNLLKNDIPIGSGYFISILGNKVSLFIEKLNRKNYPFIMIIHPWQIEKPPIDIKNLIKCIVTNPLMLPYYINRKKTLEHLLEKYEFTTFWDYIKKNNLM